MSQFIATATLLCFSVAVNADIYFCVHDKNVFIDQQTAASGGPGAENSLVVDTGQGVKWLPHWDYLGECVQSEGYAVSFGWLCNWSSDGFLREIFINTETLEHSFLVHSRGDGVTGYTGACTKA